MQANLAIPKPCMLGIIVPSNLLLSYQVSSHIHSWFVTEVKIIHIPVADPGGPRGPGPPAPIFEAPDYIPRPKLHLFTLK